MLPDEFAAIKEIKTLSRDTREYLSDFFMNKLQVIKGGSEAGDQEAINEAVMEIRHMLEKMGL